MKDIFKGIIVGIIITALLFTALPGFAVNMETIQVAFNSINLEVNGQPVSTQNILYEGTTYVPLRKAAEMLGKVVTWDGETRTAGINDAEPVSAPESTPVPAPADALSPDELEQYLQDNFSEITFTVETVKGSEEIKTNFEFSILENDSLKKTYDYCVWAKFDRFFFTDIKYAWTYTESQCEVIKQKLKEHQKAIADTVIQNFPNKKIDGSYFTAWYKYPTIEQGYESLTYYSWRNFGDPDYTADDVYNSTKISSFTWTPDGDDDF